MAKDYNEALALSTKLPREKTQQRPFSLDALLWAAFEHIRHCRHGWTMNDEGLTTMP